MNLERAIKSILLKRQKKGIKFLAFTKLIYRMCDSAILHVYIIIFPL